MIRSAASDRRALLVGALALVHEDDVEVAREAGFPRAELAHADHGERHGGRRLVDRLAEHAVPDRGDLGAGGDRAELARRRTARPPAPCRPARRRRARPRRRARGSARGRRRARRSRTGWRRRGARGATPPSGRSRGRRRGRRVAPTASATRSSRTSAASGSAAIAIAGVITGMTCAEDLAEPGRRVDQSREHLVGAHGLREAEPLEQLLGGGAVDARPRLRRTGERLEQRPVEQPLVDRAHEPGRAVVLLLQTLGVDQAERARDRRARVRVGRQVVGLQVAHDLQPVLEPAQEPVRLGQRVRVGLGDVALVGERLQRRERVRAPQRRRSAGRARSGAAGRRTPRRGCRRVRA